MCDNTLACRERRLPHALNIGARQEESKDHHISDCTNGLARLSLMSLVTGKAAPTLFNKISTTDCHRSSRLGASFARWSLSETVNEHEIRVMV